MSTERTTPRDVPASSTDASRLSQRYDPVRDSASHAPDRGSRQTHDLSPHSPDQPVAYIDSQGHEWQTLGSNDTRSSLSHTEATEPSSSSRASHRDTRDTQASSRSSQRRAESPNLTLEEAKALRDQGKRVIQGPDGKIHNIEWNGRSENTFANERGLDKSTLSRVVRGRRKHTKGYQRVEGIDPYPPEGRQEVARKGGRVRKSE